MWLVHQPADFFVQPVTRGSTASSSGAKGASGGVAAGADAAAGAQEDAAAPNLSLWGQFCTELQITHEIGEKLLNHLRTVLNTDESVKDMKRLSVTALCVQRLRAATALSAARAQAHLEGVRTTLSASQFVRYEAWTVKSSQRIAKAASHLSAEAQKAAENSANGASTA